MVKAAIDSLQPVITDIVNKSLAIGVFPSHYKECKGHTTIKEANNGLIGFKKLLPSLKPCLHFQGPGEGSSITA